MTVVLDGRVFVLHARSRDTWWRLEDAHFSATLEDAEHVRGWRLEVRPNAQSLAERGPLNLLAMARELAHLLLEHVEGERVRRLDLCADVVGFDLNRIEPRQWLAPRRARVRATGKLDENFRGGGRTGWTVGKSAVVLCAYDKREELAASCSPKTAERRAAEETRWQDAGWNGSDGVTRVEFRLLGAALDELEGGRLRDPDSALDLLDDVWRYCTYSWLRLVLVDSSSRRDRWAVEPRWSVLQQVTFIQNDGVIAVRTRRRAPAAARFVANAAINYAASAGAVGPLPFSEHDIADWSNERAAAFVRDRVLQAMSRAAERAAEELLEAYGPQGAARYVVARRNVALTRAGHITLGTRGFVLNSPPARAMRPDPHEEV